MNTPTGLLDPTPAASRLVSIDVLRGVAVLGILLMNIQFFAMIQAAYFNPTAFGDLSGINYAVWLFQHVFADQKFMTIFSMLFGAGIVLMGERAESKNLSAAWLHHRRMFWLLVLGAAHAYLLWYGDILVVYALSGLFVIWFRRRSPVTQLVVGLLMLVIGSGIYALGGLTVGEWPPEVYEQLIVGWAPGPEKIAEEVAIYQGGWLSQMDHRVPHSWEFHTVVFLAWAFWRAAGLMLIGMAFYRWGLFSATLEVIRYRRLAMVCMLTGFPIVIFGLYQQEAHGWAYEYSSFFGVLYNYWGSLLVSLAYVCLVMLWFTSGAASWLLFRMSAVGRMAFSNYIAETVICTFVFYGNGLGWFGQAQRWQQLLVVLGVWVGILLWSSWWLSRFRYGPLEWVWRSLTYLKFQPLKLER